MTFGRVLTDSIHMSGALGSSNIENILTENRTCRNLRGERSDHCATVVLMTSRAGHLTAVISIRDSVKQLAK